MNLATASRDRNMPAYPTIKAIPVTVQACPGCGERWRVPADLQQPLRDLCTACAPATLVQGKYAPLRREGDER